MPRCYTPDDYQPTEPQRDYYECAICGHMILAWSTIKEEEELYYWCECRNRLCFDCRDVCCGGNLRTSKQRVGS